MERRDSQKVTLEEMLTARERRVFLQNSLIEIYHTPVISFTLNIPGPVKVFDRIPETFEEGCEQIRRALNRAEIVLVHEETLREKTGYEAFFAAAAAPLLLKELMARLEEETPAGRLYDIDIIKQDGTKVSREELRLPCRSCLLCRSPAHECSRSRKHSVDELVLHIKRMLQEPKL